MFAWMIGLAIVFGILTAITAAMDPRQGRLEEAVNVLFSVSAVGAIIFTVLAAIAWTFQE